MARVSQHASDAINTTPHTRKDQIARPTARRRRLQDGHKGRAPKGALSGLSTQPGSDAGARANSEAMSTDDLDMFHPRIPKVRKGSVCACTKAVKVTFLTGGRLQRRAAHHRAHLVAGRASSMRGLVTGRRPQRQRARGAAAAPRLREAEGDALGGFGSGRCQGARGAAERHGRPPARLYAGCGAAEGARGDTREMRPVAVAIVRVLLLGETLKTERLSDRRFLHNFTTVPPWYHYGRPSLRFYPAKWWWGGRGRFITVTRLLVPLPPRGRVGGSCP